MNKSVLQTKFDSRGIENIKNDAGVMSSFLQTSNDGAIVYVLGKLGRFENNDNKKPLLDLLKNTNESIRSLAIKNLAKMGDISLLDTFYKFAQQDESTEVRRESVSAIGRLRDKKAIPILIKLLLDKDPKVVMQAIRGLLIFSNDNIVRQELKKIMKFIRMN